MSKKTTAGTLVEIAVYIAVKRIKWYRFIGKDVSCDLRREWNALADCYEVLTKTAMPHYPRYDQRQE